MPKLVSTGGAGESPNGIGLGLGAGWFITHDIALSLRLSGTMIPTLGIIFVGEVGPSLQVWLGPMWFGGGLGLHVVTGCDAIAGCAGDGGVGFNLRMGVAIDRTETRAIGLAIEASSGLQPSFGAGAIPSVSILIAGQIL